MSDNKKEYTWAQIKDLKGQICKYYMMTRMIKCFVDDPHNSNDKGRRQTLEYIREQLEEIEETYQLGHEGWFK